MSRELVCDFCSAPGPRFTCPARTFDTGVPDTVRALPHASDGGWAACDACAALVRNGQREKLLRRTMGLLLERMRREREPVPPRDVPIVQAAMRDLHDQFWSHREGPPRLTTDDELAAYAAMPSEYVGPFPDNLRRRAEPAWVALARARSGR